MYFIKTWTLHFFLFWLPLIFSKDNSWRSLFFNIWKPSRPSCSYAELFQNSCWTNDVAEDLDIRYITHAERLDLRDKVRDMFYFGYDNYMKHAYPMDELNPIWCSGRGSDKERPDNINVNDALGDYMLTLVDSMDTLAVMGDVDEFKQAVRKVSKNLSFNGTTVQVFESTIRIMGGLLSAHIIMTHPDRVKLFGYNFRPDDYDNELLSLARDLGSRLLPAFENTTTGIPWPRVNLHEGVPDNCSEDTATAGAGTLLLEFGVLSKLTGDIVFEQVARRAMRRLYEMKSPKTGLLGSVVNVNTGVFSNVMSGVGAGLDSFFEYLLKAHILFSDETHSEFSVMYDTLMSSVRQHLRSGRPMCHRGHGDTPIYVNVDMRTGEIVNYWIDSLQTAFSAILTLGGEIREAICQHAIYATIWQRFGVLPERYNFRLRKPDVSFYPLRPELAESTYVLYQATKNPYYLAVGRTIVNNLEQHCRAKCGYGTVHNVETIGDIGGTELEDRMESFFLAETVKYLYLLFDTENPLNVHAERIVFTTEGHIIPVGQWLRDNNGAQSTESATSALKYKGNLKRSIRWISFNNPNNDQQINLSENNDNNDSKVETVFNRSVRYRPAVSSRSCEIVNEMQHTIRPLHLRYYQQLNAEIGIEK